MINLTESAIAQINTIVSSKEETNLKLRMYIQGGGCSGFSYAFELTNEQAEDDYIVPADRTDVLIDPISLLYVEGLTIDYKDDLQGARFVMNNPSAKTTCGCGSSFSPY